MRWANLNTHRNATGLNIFQAYNRSTIGNGWHGTDSGCCNCRCREFKGILIEYNDWVQWLSSYGCDGLIWALTVTLVAWTAFRPTIAVLSGTDGMGPTVGVAIVDVDVAGSGLEPRVSVLVRDGCFDFLYLSNFFKSRFIVNSGRWYSMRNASRWVIRVRSSWLHQHRSFKLVTTRSYTLTITILRVSSVNCIAHENWLPYQRINCKILKQKLMLVNINPVNTRGSPVYSCMDSEVFAYYQMKPMNLYSTVNMRLDIRWVTERIWIVDADWIEIWLRYGAITQWGFNLCENEPLKNYQFIFYPIRGEAHFSFKKEMSLHRVLTFHLSITNPIAWPTSWDVFDWPFGSNPLASAILVPCLPFPVGAGRAC